jgi:hypothetical protein
VGEVAKTAQAHFICLAYNLATMLEGALAEKDNVTNVAEQNRRDERTDARLEEEKKKARACKRETGYLAFLNPIIPARVLVESRQTTLSVKLLRWISSFVGRLKPWEEMLAHLRRAYAEL